MGSGAGTVLPVNAGIKRTAAWGLWLAMLWIFVGVFVFVAPISSEPKRADVVFVLAPAYDRVTYAEHLMNKGYAETLVISASPSDEGKPLPSICQEKRAYPVVCFSPDPITTQGEARALKRLSEEYAWKGAVVITAQFHVTRTRVLFERCYNGELSVVEHGQDMPLVNFPRLKGSWVYHFVYETAAFAKVLLNPEC